MPLYLYPDVYASGSVPWGWRPVRRGTVKYPVRSCESCDRADGKRLSKKAIPVKSITLNANQVLLLA